MDEPFDLGIKCMIPLKIWESERRRWAIERIYLMLDQALRFKGVQIVYQSGPIFRESYLTEGSEAIPARWEMAANGISLCLRDGHVPEDSPIPEMVGLFCKQCHTILDRVKFEAITSG